MKNLSVILLIAFLFVSIDTYCRISSIRISPARISPARISPARISPTKSSPVKSGPAKISPKTIHLNASKIGGGAKGIRTFKPKLAKAGTKTSPRSPQKYQGKPFTKAKTIRTSKTAHHAVEITYTRPIYFVSPYYHYMGMYTCDTTHVVSDTNAFPGFGKGKSGGAGASQRFAVAKTKAKNDSIDIMDIEPINYLSDFSGVIPDADQRKINSMIRQYKKQTGVEIAIVLLPTLGEEVDMDQYIQLLFDRWGVGEKDINNGVLLLITTEDGMLRLQPGYGLEGIMTDYDSRHIEDSVIVPALDGEKWENGVLSAIHAITTKFGCGTIEATKQAYLAKKVKEEREFKYRLYTAVEWFVLAVLVIIIGVIIKRRTK